MARPCPAFSSDRSTAEKEMTSAPPCHAMTSVPAAGGGPGGPAGAGDMAMAAETADETGIDDGLMIVHVAEATILEFSL